MEKVGEQGRRLAKAELGIWAVMISPACACGKGAAMRLVSRSGPQWETWAAPRSGLRGSERGSKSVNHGVDAWGSGGCEPQLAAASLILDRIGPEHWSTEVNIVRKSWHVGSSWQPGPATQNARKIG